MLRLRLALILRLRLRLGHMLRCDFWFRLTPGDVSLMPMLRPRLLIRVITFAYAYTYSRVRIGVRVRVRVGPWFRVGLSRSAFSTACCF